jgi:hypothetical protein
MLNVARSERQVRAHARTERDGWSLVDLILAILMLPFGIWIWLIERVVSAVSALQRD